ncbi:MAG: CotH kinase family protein, partial [Erysipelotrichaceae bacterium]|nr:CotH kinase family protein [Erysipelotrichaceae bacterium]
ICDIPTGYSHGRGPEDGFFYLPTPTPGKANGTDGVRSITITPTVSKGGGIYNDDESLTIEIKGPGTIYYTTDGSEPTKNSKQYNGPITLTSTTVLKCKGYNTGERSSATVIQSYMINEDLKMPALSVSIDPDYLNTILSNIWVVGLERQAYVEFYEEDGSFSSPCSLALFGGNARAQAKKSYVLRFDSEWGASELNYAVFDNRDNACYDSLVLRSGSSDWNYAIIRDIVGTSIVDDYTDVDVQAYKAAILFINGRYYGIYNIREKINAHFVEEHYNVSTDSVNLFRMDGDVSKGTKSGYNALRQFARTHNLNVQANYDYVADRIDLVNLCDYWIAEGYVTNNDLLNVRLFNSSEMDGKYRYIFYDLDYAWYNVAINWYTVYIARSGGMTDHYYENDLTVALFKSKQFRELWLERLAYNLKNVWSKENVLNRINEIVELYRPEIERDRKRYGMTVKDWEEEVDLLRDWVAKRQYYFLRDTKNYFGLSEARMKELFGDLW